MTDVFINNIAAFLPNAPVGNDAMEAVLGQIGDRPSRARRAILRNNGIETRHYAIDPATGGRTHNNAELTAEAIRGLANDGFDLNSIDCLACGTTIADQLMPNHAVMVHGELATPPCEVVATSGICVAGITSLKYAWLGVAAGEFQNAVATGSELSSAVMAADRFEPEVAAKAEALARHPEVAFEKDFLRWMLSDGAGAILLQPQPRSDGISLRLDWIFERSYANEMSACMYAGAEKQPDGRLRGWNEFAPQEWLDHSIFSVKQDVKQLNEYVMLYTVEKPLLELIERRNLSADDYDYFLPHFSSMYFRDKVYEKMLDVAFDLPQNRWFTNLTTKGNTGSASIYIMLEELFRSGRLQDGQKLLCYIPESGRFSTAFMQLTVVDPDAQQ
jgi:3-oxoacyl-[acyl-carrier-protein] synthase-3